MIENRLTVKEIFTETVVSKDGKEYTRRVCIVECPRCESNYKRSYGNLNKGSKCRKCSQLENNKNKIGNGYKTVGDVSASLVNSIKQKAKSRNIPWNLTVQDLSDLYLKQNKMCALSGVPIKLYTTNIWSTTGKSRHINSSIITGSLDRIDSGKDYTIDNIQWVHKVVNIMKNTLSNNDFIWFCKNITNNNTEKENSEPSFISGNCSNAIMKKVQRLTAEEIQSNNADTRILQPNGLG